MMETIKEKCPRPTKNKVWTLYLLYHKQSNRTYIGVTTDISRRLRQHRCEIVGGARFTGRIQQKYPSCLWSLVATLSPFPTQSEVTRWERLLKIKTRGIESRRRAFESLGRGDHPIEFTSKMVEKYKVPDVSLSIEQI